MDPTAWLANVRLLGERLAAAAVPPPPDPPPFKAMTVADQMSDILRVAVALVVSVVLATRSPDCTQFAHAKHCLVPLPDISRLV